MFSDVFPKCGCGLLLDRFVDGLSDLYGLRLQLLEFGCPLRHFAAPGLLSLLQLADPRVIVVDARPSSFRSCTDLARQSGEGTACARFVLASLRPAGSEPSAPSIPIAARPADSKSAGDSVVGFAATAANSAAGFRHGSAPDLDRCSSDER